MLWNSLLNFVDDKLSFYKNETSLANFNVFQRQFLIVTKIRLVSGLWFQYSKIIQNVKIYI